MAPQKYYTVGVSNKFAAFGADSDATSDDGDVILSAPPAAALEQQQQQDQPQHVAVAAKKKEHHHQQNNSSPRERQQDRPPRNNRGGFGEGRSGIRGEGRGAFRGARGRPEVSGEGVEGEEEQQQGGGDGEGRHRRRGGLGAGLRGGRGGRGAFRGREGREFDRHSGTGRGREIKKAGGGGHNWGGEENTPEAKNEVQQQLTPDNKSGEQAENVEGANGEVAAGVVTEEPAVPEEVSMDLATYKRLQAERRANLPSFVSGTAAPKTIETDKELAAQGYVRLQRAGGTANDAAEGGEGDEDAREDRPKKKAVNVFEFVHNEGGRMSLFPRRGGNAGRGGRGSARGGEDHSPRGRAPSGIAQGAAVETPGPRRRGAPNLEDTRAFPTLGAR